MKFYVQMIYFVLRLLILNVLFVFVILEAGAHHREENPSTIYIARTIY